MEMTGRVTGMAAAQQGMGKADVPAGHVLRQDVTHFRPRACVPIAFDEPSICDGSDSPFLRVG